MLNTELLMSAALNTESLLIMELQDDEVETI